MNWQSFRWGFIVGEIVGGALVIVGFLIGHYT